MGGIALAMKTGLAAVRQLARSKADSIKGDNPEAARKLEELVGLSNILESSKGSIVNLAKRYTVEPLIIVSSTVKDYDILDKVMEFNLDVFAGFYTQAFNILANDSVKSRQINIALTLLGTDRGIDGGLAKAMYNRYKISNEDYVTELLSDNAFLTITKKDEVVSNEDSAEVKNKYDTEAIKILQRTVEITITLDVNNKVVIPIIIRAAIKTVDVDNIVAVVSPRSADKSIVFRWMDWRAGVISFKDLVLAGDLIKEYKQNKLKDAEGILEKNNQDMLTSYTKGTRVLLADATKSRRGFQAGYNMVIISEDDRAKINLAMNGDIGTRKHAESFLTNIQGLTLAILSPDYERMVMFTKDIDGKTDLSFDSLRKRKDNNQDLTGLVKALMTNQAPRF